MILFVSAETVSLKTVSHRQTTCPLHVEKSLHNFLHMLYLILLFTGAIQSTHHQHVTAVLGSKNYQLPYLPSQHCILSLKLAHAASGCCTDLLHNLLSLSTSPLPLMIKQIKFYMLAPENNCFQGHHFYSTSTHFPLA